MKNNVFRECASKTAREGGGMAYFWFSTLIAKYMHPNVIIFNLQQVYMYI